MANLGHNTAKKRSRLSLKKSPVIDDLRVIDMYDAAVRHDIRLKDRAGNWVQNFVTPEDTQLFAAAQFYRYQEVEGFLKEQFEDRSTVMKEVVKEVKS